MFTYTKRKGWQGGMGTALYAITDKRTGAVTVRPGNWMNGIGPEVTIRVATRAEADKHWQSPLHTGWIIASAPVARRTAVFQAWQRTGRVSLTFPCFSERRMRLTKRAIRLDTIWQREVRIAANRTPGL